MNTPLNINGGKRRNKQAAAQTRTQGHGGRFTRGVFRVYGEVSGQKQELFDYRGGTLGLSLGPILKGRHQTYFRVDFSKESAQSLITSSPILHNQSLKPMTTKHQHSIFDKNVVIPNGLSCWD